MLHKIGLMLLLASGSVVANQSNLLVEPNKVEFTFHNDTKSSMHCTGVIFGREYHDDLAVWSIPVNIVVDPGDTGSVDLNIHFPRMFRSGRQDITCLRIR